MEEIKKGTFIVIEGGDGSGKGTQSKLLTEYFEQKNIPYAYVDFPNYESFYGKLIASFLRGELGQLQDISPYLAALPFALDRREMKQTIENYLQEGKIIIANRYVSSNMAHQGGRIEESKKEEFLKWLEELEYSVHGIPKPHLTAFLYMPWQQAKELTSQKDSREYLQGKTQDIQEADDEHRIQTEKMYQYLARRDSSWKTINCIENGTIKTKDQIHGEIITLLKNEGLIT